MTQKATVTVEQAVEAYGRCGTIEAAAADLGVGRATLHRRLQEHRVLTGVDRVRMRRHEAPWGFGPYADRMRRLRASEVERDTTRQRVAELEVECQRLRDRLAKVTVVADRVVRIEAKLDRALARLPQSNVRHADRR